MLAPGHWMDKKAGADSRRRALKKKQFMWEGDLFTAVGSSGWLLFFGVVGVCSFFGGLPKTVSLATMSRVKWFTLPPNNMEPGVSGP